MIVDRHETVHLSEKSLCFLTIRKRGMVCFSFRYLFEEFGWLNKLISGTTGSNDNKIWCSFQTLTIFLAYVISVYILWTPQREFAFRVTSQLLWLVISSFIASLTGSLQVYTFVFLQAICVTGFALEVIDVHKKMLEKGKFQCLKIL